MGKKETRKRAIYIDTFHCKMCGTCMEESPETFTMNEFTQMPEVAEDVVEVDDSVRMAVVMCPTKCIHVEGED